MRRLLVIALVVSALGAAAPAARAKGVDGRVRLVLEGALRWQSVRPSRDPWADTQDLELDLVGRGGTWDAAAWGWTRYVPGQEHLGRVTRTRTEGDRVEIVVDMEINPSRHDPCVLGGPARLRLLLERDGDAFTGAFEAETTDTNRPDVRRALEDAWGMGETPGKRDGSQPTLDNHLRAFLKTTRVEGRVTGRREGPPPPNRLADLAPGEHPRLFFRKDDLDALRRRAATGAGRAVLAELEALLERADRHGYGFRYPRAHHTMGPVWATGWGLLYQWTGDESYARKAARQFDGPLYGSYYYGGGWLHAYTMMGLGAAYDLAADGWDEETRGLVYGYLAHNIRDLAHRHDGPDPLNVLDRYAFANDQSEFRFRGPADGGAVKFRAGAAIAALALLYDPPPSYEPTPPGAVAVLDPPADFEPWLGVPVVELESDQMFRDWLVNGPFLRGTSDAAMEQLGGWRTLRVEPGDAVEVEGVRLDFRRYRPTGADDPNGPTIYCRNGNRYWTSATGGGYWPGIELVRRWRERSDRRPALDVVLYTVLGNRRDRVVQALPNWRSRASGNRMWIAGRRVEDGDLVRLRPGFYPVVVNVALKGAYSAMAPKLREYTPEMYAADVARAEGAREAYASRGVFENEMERNLAILERSIRRYIDATVGPDGWGGWGAHETLLPYVLALRNVTGRDPSRGTGLERLVPLACRMRGRMRDRTFDFMVSQSFPLMPPDHRPVARWYMERYGRGLERPLDAVIALATHPIDGPTEPPAARFPLAHAYEHHGVYTFASGWNGPEDFFTMIETGRPAPENSVLDAGNLRIQGRGRYWAVPYRDGRHPERGFTELNNVSVRRIYPVGPARVEHSEVRPDGSGAVAMVMDEMRDLVRMDHKVFELAEEDSGIAIHRCVAVDYSGRSGAGALVVTVDRLHGTGRREKVWRMNLGEVYTDTAYNRHHPTLLVERDAVTVRPPKTDATMRVTFVRPPEGFELRTRPPRTKNGRGTVLEAKVDRFISETELAEEALTAEVSDEIRADVFPGDQPGADVPENGPPPTEGAEVPPEDAQGIPPAPPEPSGPPAPRRNTAAPPLDPADSEDAALHHLMGELNRHLSDRRDEADRKLPPVTFITVMTIQTGEAPEVHITGPDDDLTLRVGDRTIRFDGRKLTFGE